MINNYYNDVNLEEDGRIRPLEMNNSGGVSDRQSIVYNNNNDEALLAIDNLHPSYDDETAPIVVVDPKRKKKTRDIENSASFAASTTPSFGLNRPLLSTVGSAASTSTRTPVGSNIAPADEDATLIGQLSGEQQTATMITADHVLALFGTSNPYILLIWISMSAVWGLCAMPVMVSSFLVSSDACRSNVTAQNCTLDDGSLAKEFNLVGERAILADYTSTAFLVGVTVGAFFLPPLSDSRGRRVVLLGGMASAGIFGTVSAFSPNIYVFIALRFLTGIFFTSATVTNWILAYESIPLPLRSYTALVSGLFWVFGYCAVAPLAYFLSTWRILILTVSVPSSIATVVFYFTIPESFHYLVSKRRRADLERWVGTANTYARRNGSPTVQVSVVDELLESHYQPSNGAAFARNGMLETTEAVERNDATVAPKKRCRVERSLVYRIVSNRLLFIYFLVMLYLWICDNFVYYGLSIFSARLAGNRYVNFTLMGLIEIPSYLVSPVCLDRFGRRRFVGFCHLLAAISLFAVTLTDIAGAHLAMWLLGKFAISAAFTALFVYASEVFPTVVRNGCIGMCSAISNIGGALGPSVQATALIYPSFPMLFFGTFASVGAAVTYILPETLNQELPDAPEEVTG